MSKTVFDWIKNTPRNQRNITQYFIMYGCTWGAFFLSIVGFIAAFAWGISLAVNGAMVEEILRVIVLALISGVMMVFGCSAISFFNLW